MENHRKTLAAADVLLGNNVLASAAAGEMVFIKPVPVDGSIPGMERSAIKYLFSGISSLLRGFKGTLKDKKKMLPVMILSAVWVLLMIPSVLGVNNSLLTFLNFLSFGRGGTSGGTIGLIGGIVGRGVYAYFLFSFILPLFSGRKPFSGLGRQIKGLFGLVAAKDRKKLFPLLVGAGFALMAYNFLAGNASLQNGMVGIGAFFISLRALWNKSGFLWGFVCLLVNKCLKSNTCDISMIQGILSGWTAGFVLSLPISAVGISKGSYLTGMVAMIAAIIIVKVPQKSKGVAI